MTPPKGVLEVSPKQSCMTGVMGDEEKHPLALKGPSVAAISCTAELSSGLTLGLQAVTNDRMASLEHPLGSHLLGRSLGRELC